MQIALHQHQKKKKLLGQAQHRAAEDRCGRKSLLPQMFICPPPPPKENMVKNKKCHNIFLEIVLKTIFFQKHIILGQNMLVRGQKYSKKAQKYLKKSYKICQKSKFRKTIKIIFDIDLKIIFSKCQAPMPNTMHST